MTTYVPRHFAGDEATARQLIAEYPFATLITAASDGPFVTHLPLLLDDAGTALLGHVARPNPHWQAFARGPTVAIFHGPHAFVSRGWYASPADNVPTWNYAAVHVSGAAAVLDTTANAAIVDRLSARFEPDQLPPVAPDYRERLLRGIVAFRLPLTRIDVKLKMSQNKPAAERAGVIRGLRATGRAEALATAQWMEAHEPGSAP